MKQNSRRSQRLAGALYIILPWAQILPEGEQSRPPFFSLLPHPHSRPERGDALIGPCKKRVLFESDQP